MTGPDLLHKALVPSTPLRVGARLSEQLADALVASIRSGQLRPVQRLPTEAAAPAERLALSSDGSVAAGNFGGPELFSQALALMAETP